MVSCGSSFLWCSCKQCTGQNLFSLSKPDGWGGRKAWAACAAVGRAMVSGSLLHIIDSPSKCAHLEAWGPEAKNWGSHSLLMTQKSEGSIASLCEKRKKSLVWNGERGGGGKSCLHNDKGTVLKPSRKVPQNLEWKLISVLPEVAVGEQQAPATSPGFLSVTLEVLSPPQLGYL